MIYLTYSCLCIYGIANVNWSCLFVLAMPHHDLKPSQKLLKALQGQLKPLIILDHFQFLRHFFRGTLSHIEAYNTFCCPSISLYPQLSHYLVASILDFPWFSYTPMIPLPCYLDSQIPYTSNDPITPSPPITKSISVNWEEDTTAKKS